MHNFLFTADVKIISVLASTLLMMVGYSLTNFCCRCYGSFVLNCNFEIFQCHRYSGVDWSGEQAGYSVGSIRSTHPFGR